MQTAYRQHMGCSRSLKMPLQLFPQLFLVPQCQRTNRRQLIPAQSALFQPPVQPLL